MHLKVESIQMKFILLEKKNFLSKPLKVVRLEKVFIEILRNNIKNAGAVYHRSVYGMLPDGTLVNFQLKGSGVKAYSDFYNDNNHLLDNQWIEINEAKEGKKGAVKFTTPEFKIGSNINKAEDKLANECAESLETYMDSYFGRKDVEVDEIDEVPF